MLHSKPVITVTGTNGKGSVVAYCESILTAAGYHVGAYYSPHVFKINERIRYNGNYISDKECPEFINFEDFTQKALNFFETKSLDVYILEVGIGGRLDPVNRVEPDVSVITSIDFDHMDKLGNTLELIGWEKAHIFRSNKPAICNRENIPQSVINYANQIGAKLYLCDNNNIALALEALKHINVKISQENIEQGIKNMFLPGRFQVINNTILDVAHNPASARLLAKNIKKLNSRNKIIGVVGMLKDKDIANTLKPLLPIIDIWHVASLDDPRGATAKELAAFLPESLLFDDVKKAYNSAIEKSGQNDKVLVFGSFRTVGAVNHGRE